MRQGYGSSENQQYRQTFIQTNQKTQRENIQINKIRNKKGNAHNNGHRGSQRIIRSYFKMLYSTKLKNLNYINTCAYKYQLPKLNQDQISKLKRSNH